MRNNKLCQYMGNTDFHEFILQKCVNIIRNICLDIAPCPEPIPIELTDEEIGDFYGLTEEVDARVMEALKDADT